MSFFDLPGSTEAIIEWNSARAAHGAACEAFDRARKHHWETLKRLANAHKRAVEISGPEYADGFLWPVGLYGDRDKILEMAANEKGPNAELSGR